MTLLAILYNVRAAPWVRRDASPQQAYSVRWMQRRASALRARQATGSRHRLIGRLRTRQSRGERASPRLAIGRYLQRPHGPSR